jgi:hypothetical protein
MTRETLMDDWRGYRMRVMHEKFLAGAPLLRSMPCVGGVVEHATYARCDEPFSALPANIQPTKLPTNLEYNMLQVPVEVADEYPGGKGQWFADNLCALLVANGRRTEHDVIYNVLRQHAAKQCSIVDAGGGGYSIGIATWDMANTCLVTSDPLVDVTWYNGREKYKDCDGREVYGCRISAHMTMKLDEMSLVSWLCNVSKDDSELCGKVDKMLCIEEGDDVSLICHPDIAAKLRGRFSGVDIISTRNMVSNESHVTV